LIYSPLRYPGGKSKLTGFFSNYLKENSLLGVTYIEPYAGGAGVGLGLLINKVVSNIVINDIDRSIYAFWWSILNKTDAFCDKLLHISISIEEWKTQKQIQKEKEHQNLFDLGFSTFYLNRTNRSGIIKAGMIGGWKQDGDYKLDCRFKKQDLIDRIKLISTYADKITIKNEATEDLLDNFLTGYTNKEAFIYFDPPYFEKGKKLYTNFYNEEDHVHLKNLIQRTANVPWIMTYDYNLFIQNLYSEYRQEVFELTYSAAIKRKSSELMIYSN
jgi:DNA adenine methylase